MTVVEADEGAAVVNAVAADAEAAAVEAGSG